MTQDNALREVLVGDNTSLYHHNAGFHAGVETMVTMVEQWRDAAVETAHREAAALRDALAKEAFRDAALEMLREAHPDLPKDFFV